MNYPPPQGMPPYGPPGGGAPPFGAPPPGGPPPFGAPPPMGVADPRGAVQGPGIAMIVLGVLVLFGQAAYLVMQLLGTGLSAVGGGDVAGVFSGVVGMVFTALWMVLSGILIFGGIKMKNLQSYGLAMAAAVIAMLPCTIGWCCLFGLPIGIWALVVLMKPEVKAAFR
jgi:hypothetical protein